MDKAKEALWTRSFVLDTLINFLVFLIYYLVRYGIGCRRDFIVYHYRVAYRLYLEKLIMKQGFVAC